MAGKEDHVYTYWYQKNPWTVVPLSNFDPVRQINYVIWFPEFKALNWTESSQTTRQWAWNEQQGKWKESLFFKDETVFSFMV